MILICLIPVLCFSQKRIGFGFEYSNPFVKDIYAAGIGITSQNVKKRYGSFVKEEQIKFLLTGNMYSSFQLEQILKHKLKEFKILPEEQIGEFGWTETFKISSNYVINIIDNIKNIEEEFKLIYDR